METNGLTYTKGELVRINVPDESEHGTIGTVAVTTTAPSLGSKAVFVTVPSVGKDWLYRPRELQRIPTPRYRDLL